jgi:hypothetical protein
MRFREFPVPEQRRIGFQELEWEQKMETKEKSLQLCSMGLGLFLARFFVCYFCWPGFLQASSWGRRRGRTSFFFRDWFCVAR